MIPKITIITGGPGTGKTRLAQKDILFYPCNIATAEMCRENEHYIKAMLSFSQECLIVDAVRMADIINVLAIYKRLNSEKIIYFTTQDSRSIFDKADDILKLRIRWIELTDTGSNFKSNL